MSFGEARVRLAALARDGALEELCRAAHADGLALMTRTDPVPGWLISSLALVRLLEPVSHSGRVNVGLRWEAADLHGDLFTALDANITLLARDPGQSLLVLTGAYRAPAAGSDRAGQGLLGRLATATLGCLARDIAGALAADQPGGSAGEGS
ncbi:MAG: hypothetical protein ACM3ML_02910 [Micromonosporaceae bacterium]